MVYDCLFVLGVLMFLLWLCAFMRVFACFVCAGVCVGCFVGVRCYVHVVACCLLLFVPACFVLVLIFCALMLVSTCVRLCFLGVGLFYVVAVVVRVCFRSCV